MKYINHMTCAGDDEKIQSLRDRHGVAGYGIYWLLIERVAAQIRPESISTSLTLSVSKWAKYLDIKPGYLLKTVSTCSELGLISVERRNDLVTIGIPNILKYCDEYTRKVRRVSGQTPDKDPDKRRIPSLTSLTGSKST